MSDDDTVDIAPIPLTIRARCIATEHQWTPGGYLCWCEHSHYGGWYLPAEGRWVVTGPFVDFAAFDRFLVERLAGRSRDDPPVVH